MASVVARYRAVIAPARGPVLGYLASGTSVSLKPLAAVFLLREAGQPYDLIGLVLAAEVLGSAVGMITQGRLIDRFGPRRVLPVLVVAHVVALLAFVVAVNGSGSRELIVGLTFLWGFSQPVLLPTLRALWGQLFADEERETAYAAQAVLTELVFILGPLFASVVSLLVSPTAALILAAVLCAIGVLLFSLTIPRRTPAREDAAEAKREGGVSVLRNGRLRVLILVAALSGVIGGAIEILLPVLAESGGSIEWAGVGFAAIAVGSIAGGLVYGSRRWKGTVVGRMALFTGALALLLLPLIATPVFVIACAVLLFAGATIAPAEACLYLLIDDAASDASVVEANSWVTALYTLGLGIGAAVGGHFVDVTSVAAAAALPSAAALISVVIILTAIRRDDPASVDHPEHEHETQKGPLAAT